MTAFADAMGGITAAATGLAGLAAVLLRERKR